MADAVWWGWVVVVCLSACLWIAGSEGGRRDGLLGVVCHTYLPATQEQHDVYVYVGLCVCRSVTPNSGVKSEKHFHLELIHSAAKERSPALAPGHLIKFWLVAVSVSDARDRPALSP